MCSDFVTSHGEFPFLFKTGGDLKVHAPGRHQGSSSAACAQICTKPPPTPPEMKALTEAAGGFAWGRGPLRIILVRACVRAVSERAWLDGVGFSPPNLPEHHHSDHSNSPVRIIITTLLLLIFPIILQAEEGQPRRGKR